MAKVKVAKPKSSPTDKLHIVNEMAQLDLKNQEFYDSLTIEEKKKFSSFLMLKWAPSVYASAEMQTYYLMSVNENVNVNFFNISKHPKLQWLCCTAASPGMGRQKHYWLASKKKEGKAPSTALRKKMLEQFPSVKSKDIDSIIKFSTIEQLEKWLESLGCDQKTIQEILG